MDNSLSVSSSELTAICRDRYPAGYHFTLDIDYNIPVEAAMPAFNAELASLLFDKYGDKWQDYFDCENFTFEAIVLAFYKHWISRQAGKGNAQGVGFGLLCFRVVPTDWSSGHCVVSRLRSDKTLIEYEPQTRKDLILTPAQCQSVSLSIWL